LKNKFVNRKLEKGGWSVPRAPVEYNSESLTLLIFVNVTA
jgi:hypothetical protein